MKTEQINELLATKVWGWTNIMMGTIYNFDMWWKDIKHNVLMTRIIDYTPASNWIQAFEALEKFCIDNDYKIRIEIQPHCCIVEIGGRGFPWHRGQVVYMSASNKVDAICNALIEALEKK